MVAVVVGVLVFIVLASFVKARVWNGTQAQAIWQMRRRRRSR
jgi:hypothetical protein